MFKKLEMLLGARREGEIIVSAFSVSALSSVLSSVSLISPTTINQISITAHTLTDSGGILSKLLSFNSDFHLLR